MDVERRKNVAVYVRVARQPDVGRDSESQRRAIEQFCRDNNQVVAATVMATCLAVDQFCRQLLRTLAQCASDETSGRESDRGDRHAH
ncbi:Hypothetical protein PFR_JS13-2_762 [Propionibacterium freudenreichii]|nr:Hypothetical protein PFR_JS11_773 [Propionibacterium freudenreichii]SBN95152.1 Hypothetical protein PFR_JS12-2_768 [Propionibacterium freudenreichii]SCC96738.1 Hypothetical protein PFR_JS12-1_770 [Propionibacterium freudenreichii]SCQ48135.1 Hypothetical protein PFR_JS13-1_773 [Propionibacterium freudenreichii]SCQ52389.1 Hypothetical protein PFR_JS13-2_762 [Propionibacterium freudenreichii]